MDVRMQQLLDRYDKKVTQRFKRCAEGGQGVRDWVQIGRDVERGESFSESGDSGGGGGQCIGSWGVIVASAS